MTTQPEARPGSLDSAYDASITWRYIAPSGHTLKDCMRPDYWSNVRREAGLQRVVGRHAWNKIEIIAEDGTWEADLRVMAVDGGLVTTRLLRAWRETETKAETPVPDGYTVEHIPNNGWRALDRKGQILTEKRSTRDQAMAAVAEHQRAVKGGK